jgi:hypothetical protein
VSAPTKLKVVEAIFFVLICRGEREEDMWRLVLLVTLSAPAMAQQPPTARTKCAQLAEKMVEKYSRPAITVSQLSSHYEPRTKRCYVQMTTRNIDDPNKYTNVGVFDGQTKDLLAYIKIEDGSKSGIVFDRRHRTKSLTNAGWDDANEYIDQMMAEDRK